MTFYYYLASLSDGRWALYSSLDPRPTIFADKLAAMLEAKNRCRLHWSKTGMPCGVRIQADHGLWHEHYLVGDMDGGSSETRSSGRPPADDCRDVATESSA